MSQCCVYRPPVPLALGCASRALDAVPNLWWDEAMSSSFRYHSSLPSQNTYRPKTLTVAEFEALGQPSQLEALGCCRSEQHARAT